MPSVASDHPRSQTSFLACYTEPRCGRGREHSQNIHGAQPALRQGDVAVEVTPIENWLELEGGVTPLLSRHTTEWDADLLFKKPWTISNKVEFMVGAGPEWIRLSRDHTTANSAGAQGVLDWMFWRSANHRFGWFLEPSYEYSFGRGREQSIGISGGILIGIGVRHPKTDRFGS